MDLRSFLSVPLALVIGYIFVFHQTPYISSKYLRQIQDQQESVRKLFHKNTEPPANHVTHLLEARRAAAREVKVNCSAILAGDKAEIARGKVIRKSLVLTRKQEIAKSAEYLSDTADCVEFGRKHGFLAHHLTHEEQMFPLAFSVLTYKDVEMLVRMLAAFYRPQHYFCLHIDQTANEDFRKVVTAIAKCFHNIVLPSRTVNVRWGNYTIVEAEVLCMKALWRHRKWKYFINLTGQEMPLRTNYEIVQILKAFKGGNDVDGTLAARRPHRWEFFNTEIPEGITPVMGSTHVAVNRDFVKYLLFHPVGRAIQKWLKPTLVPDETVFATLNHNPQLGIPGTYRGLAETEAAIGHKPFYTRYKMWYSDPCAGQQRNGICLLSIGDLKRMTSSPFYIANKFHLNEDRLVIGCLEEMLANRTLDFYLGRRSFDTTIYEQSVVVKNMIPANETISFNETDFQWLDNKKPDIS